MSTRLEHIAQINEAIAKLNDARKAINNIDRVPYRFLWLKDDAVNNVRHATHLLNGLSDSITNQPVEQPPFEV